MNQNTCTGEHEFYVVECVGVEAEAKVCVIVVCRHCGEIHFHEHIVATKATPLRLLNEEKRK